MKLKMPDGTIIEMTTNELFEMINKYKSQSSESEDIPKATNWDLLKLLSERWYEEDE